MIYPTQPRKGKKRGEPLGTRPNKSRKRAQREQEPRQREDPGRNKHTITRGGTKMLPPTLETSGQQEAWIPGRQQYSQRMSKHTGRKAV